MVYIAEGRAITDFLLYEALRTIGLDVSWCSILDWRLLDSFIDRNISRFTMAKSQVVDTRDDHVGLRVRGVAAVADAQEAVADEFGGILVHDEVPHVVS